MLVGDFRVEILPKASRPSVIPKELRSKLPNYMYSVRVRVTEIAAHYNKQMSKVKNILPAKTDSEKTPSSDKTSHSDKTPSSDKTSTSDALQKPVSSNSSQDVSAVRTSSLSLPKLTAAPGLKSSIMSPSTSLPSSIADPISSRSNSPTVGISGLGHLKIHRSGSPSAMSNTDGIPMLIEDGELKRKKKK